MDKKAIYTKYPDLTKIERTVSNIFTIHKLILDELYNDPSVSFEVYKEIIIDLINESKDVPSKRRILVTAQNLKDKDDAIFFVWNTKLAGMGEKVIR